MKKGIANLNDDRFVKAALDPIKREKLIQNRQVRRNIYFGLCVAWMIVMYVSMYSTRATAAIAPAVLAIMCFTLGTRYDTQLKLLKIIQKQSKTTTEQGQ